MPSSFTAQIKFLLRRSVLAMLRFLLRVRSRPLAMDFGGPVLVIAPHPDDESFGCGALIHCLGRSGLRREIAFLTDGGASHPEHPVLDRNALVSRRKAEALGAAAFLEVDAACLHFIGLPDGTLPRFTDAGNAGAIHRLRTIFLTLKPAAVLLPWRHDGSTEHESAFSLVQTVLAALDESTRPRLIEFPVWAAWSPRLFLGAIFRRHHVFRFYDAGDSTFKRRAMEAYSSQLEPVPPWSRPVLPAGFISLFKHADEFFFETSP